MSLNQRFGYVFGAVYALVGVVGFAVTRGIAFSATKGKELILFQLNPLHNVVHIAVGALLIAGAVAGAAWSARINLTVGVVYLAVAAVGLFAVGHNFNILALNQADNGLHLATAILALGVALTKEGRRDLVTA